MFLDESGFLLIPNVRKTWAPIGETPILRPSYKRDKISVISSVTVSPRQHRLGLSFQFPNTNLTGIEIIQHLQLLLRHLPGHVVLLWDGGTIHRRKIVTEFLLRHKKLHVYRFPAYAPELNPDEFIWTQTKRSLSNATPKDISELSVSLRRSIHRIRNAQSLLRSCIQASKLPGN